MVNKLEATKNAGLVYGNYYYTDEDGKILDVEFKNRLANEDIASQLPPHGACTLFRTRSLKNVGGYSEKVNAQDGWDLWYKLFGRIGAANLDVPIFYYRQHGNSMSRDCKRLLEARSRIFDQISQGLEGDYKPTIVFTRSGDELIASARSVRGFDLYAALLACQDYIIQFGGHKYAAGLTIRPEQYVDFCQRVDEVVSNQILPEQQERTLSIDMEIPISEITPKFFRIINRMAPFGPGNMRPVLISKGVLWHTCR